jgi:hypothetical protein
MGSDLPPNLETLVISVLKASDCFNLIDNMANYPSLKMLDIGWKCIRLDPEAPRPKLPHYHGDFTKSQVLDVLHRCAEAGIEFQMGYTEPPYRLLQHWVDQRRLSRGEPEFADDGTKIYTVLFVTWPYKEWDKLCEEFESDPKTGYRWDMPPPEGWTFHGFGSGGPTEWDSDEDEAKEQKNTSNADANDDEDDDEGEDYDE